MRLAWLADALRAEGLDVLELSGWKGRGKELTTVRGVVEHNTVTNPSTADANVDRLLRDGRPDLAGPLCQLGLRRSGTFVAVADGRGNHNGYGLWGNESIGIEVYNDGYDEPWTDAQVHACEVGTAAICRRLGLDPATQVKGHRETDPTRKVDPRPQQVDLDALRHRIAARIGGSAPQPTPTSPSGGDYDMDRINLSGTLPVRGRHVDNLQGLLLPILGLTKRTDLVASLVNSQGIPDGVAGAGTAEALEVAQQFLKFVGSYTGAVDRDCGPATWRALIEN